MTTLLVDTNIFLDVMLERDGLVNDSEVVLEWCGYRPGQVWLAWHGLATLYYVGIKLAGKAKTEKYIAEILDVFEIPPTDTSSAQLARMLPIPDFEDAMQVAAADKVKANFIITRNLKDYNKSPIPAISPEEFVERFV